MNYTIKQLSIFLENKAGELSEFTGVLSKNNISIKSILLADSTDFGLIRTIVDNPEKAKTVLEDEGFSVRFTDVFGVKIEDVVGSFDKAVRALSKAGINILYTYSFYEANTGIFIFSVDKDRFDDAIAALQAQNIEIVQAKHFYM
ncbi:ACT domain-containing protein [Sulfurospirillum diekertiae]|uniref:ACT domain-containing protein n=1 Tax=Sulfurospirillum diekertiae TaxID=1854492 RepID=A0A6G9VUN5_9BACT|nr:ACT domain-containing protein [Sulfurospirillum diekertiae]QIR77105.1 ACT domain-containing protein [Sulfurospirillum diekertiae]QIR79719.1 ACT domain-containing protein [Sulfurospirillum diekertiae]